MFAVSVELVTQIPAACPSELPDLSIARSKGLNPQQLEEVLNLARKTAEENLGMPSIFVVCEAIREWCQDNNLPGQDGSMYAQMMRRTQLKEVEVRKKEERASLVAMAESERSSYEERTPEELERIRRRQAGTPVTAEAFMAWKAKFEAEKRLSSGVEVGGKESSEREDDRPTGRQLFLSNQAGRETDVMAAAMGEDGEEEEGGEMDGDEEDDDSDSDYEEGEGSRSGSEEES